MIGKNLQSSDASCWIDGSLAMWAADLQAFDGSADGDRGLTDLPWRPISPRARCSEYPLIGDLVREEIRDLRLA